MGVIAIITKFIKINEILRTEFFTLVPFWAWGPYMKNGHYKTVTDKAQMELETQIVQMEKCK